MKHWQKHLSTLLAAGTLLSAGLIAPPAHSQDMDGRKVLHVTSVDFPPDVFAQDPIPPVQETRFWRLLDREMQASETLALSGSLEGADYRVELRCGGALHCTRLAVDIKNIDRDLLASFSIKGFRPFMGLGKPDLELVARTLVARLDERLKLLEQGGYGHTE